MIILANLHAVPRPVISITIDYTEFQVLAEGASIDLVCDANLNIDDLLVTVEWYYNEQFPLVNSSNYTVSILPNSYISTLHIQKLTQRDDGAIYTCSMRFEADSMFVNASEAEDSIVISLGKSQKQLYNVIIMYVFEIIKYLAGFSFSFKTSQCICDSSNPDCINWRIS